MCAKLKCCMNYEVDNYIEASRRLPSKEISLHTQDAEYFLFKSDILAGLVTYSTDKKQPVNTETITSARAREIIEMNKRGEKPLSLVEGEGQNNNSRKSNDLLADADISRFDKAKKKKRKKKRKENDREGKA